MQSIVSEMNFSSRGVVFCRLTATERGLVGGAAFDMVLRLKHRPLPCPCLPISH